LDSLWKGTGLRLNTSSLLRFGALRLAALGLVLAAPLAFAGTIKGTVMNKTTGKVAAGDKVSLLSLSAALDEVGTTKTDAKGEFTLTTPSEAPYLVKVEHQTGAYFKNVPPGTTDIQITVYDVAAKVEGVSTEADVMRLEATNGQLKVTENYFVRNTSSPPRTQSSEHTYEVVLPPEAVLDGAATTGPSNMPISATPDPISPKGHYAFSYPIRPNEGDSGTRFQLTYHMPYSGSFKFSPKLMQASENFAVLLPKSMKFVPGDGTSFQPIMDDPNAQTYLMKNVAAGQELEFTVSGTGSMSRDDQAGAQGGPAGQGSADAEAGQNGPGSAPGKGIGNPIDTRDPLDKYKWWILGGLGLALVVAAAFLLRKPAAPPVHPPLSPAGTKRQILLDAMKDELFALETDKIEGKVSPEEYAEAKHALEIVLKRAFARS
jgi:hypothetical protein